MIKIFFNPNNVPPTWYTGIPAAETSIRISQEDFDFCEQVAHKYKLNLNEFCALVHYARQAKTEISLNAERHPLSEAIDSGALIKGIQVHTTAGKYMLNDPYIKSLLIQRYKDLQSFAITLRGLLSDHLSYLEGQKKGPSQRRVIIGLICVHLSLYIGTPLMTKEEWNHSTEAATWEKYLEDRVKAWIKDFDIYIPDLQ